MKEILGRDWICSACKRAVKIIPENAQYFKDPTDPNGTANGVWYECEFENCGSTQVLPEEKILDLPKAKKLRNKVA